MKRRFSPGAIVVTLERSAEIISRPRAEAGGTEQIASRGLLFSVSDLVKACRSSQRRTAFFLSPSYLSTRFSLSGSLSAGITSRSFTSAASLQCVFPRIHVFSSLQSCWASRGGTAPIVAFGSDFTLRMQRVCERVCVCLEVMPDESVYFPFCPFLSRLYSLFLNLSAAVCRSKLFTISWKSERAASE